MSGLSAVDALRMAIRREIESLSAGELYYVALRMAFQNLANEREGRAQLLLTLCREYTEEVEEEVRAHEQKL